MIEWITQLVKIDNFYNEVINSVEIGLNGNAYKIYAYFFIIRTNFTNFVIPFAQFYF